MLRQVSKRNPNRCFVMSLPFVHSLWPAFAAQAAVVCIFKKQTLAADTPVQMQALRLRYSCAWLRMEDPVFDISVCAQHTQHVHDIIHLLAGLLPHPATVSGPLVTPLLYCKPTAEIIGTVCHKNAMYSKIQRHDVGKDMKRLSRGFKDSGCFHFCRNWCWL